MWSLYSQAIVLLLLVYVAGLCTAQPTKPSIPETFVAEYEVEKHDRDGLQFGIGHMARDIANNRAVFNTSYDDRRDIDYDLELYGEHEMYSIKGPKNEGHCSKESLDTDMLPKYWSWLDRAKYVGQREIRHVKYDIWMTEEGGVRQELGVDADTNSSANIPKFYTRRLAEVEILVTFMKFSAVDPKVSDFTIPQECTPPPTLFTSRDRVRPYKRLMAARKRGHHGHRMQHKRIDHRRQFGRNRLYKI